VPRGTIDGPDVFSLIMSRPNITTPWGLRLRKAVVPHAGPNSIAEVVSNPPPTTTFHFISSSASSDSAAAPASASGGDATSGCDAGTPRLQAGDFILSLEPVDAPPAPSGSSAAAKESVQNVAAILSSSVAVRLRVLRGGSARTEQHDAKAPPSGGSVTGTTTGASPTDRTGGGAAAPTASSSLLPAPPQATAANIAAAPEVRAARIFLATYKQLLLKPVAGAGDGGGFLFSPTTTATPGSQPQPGEGQRFAAAPAAGVASSSPSSLVTAAESAAAPSPLAGMLDSIIRSCGPHITPGTCDWRRLATMALARHASSRYLTPPAASVLFAGCASSPLASQGSTAGAATRAAAGSGLVTAPPTHDASRRRERES
jgi:hypothetical protein